MELIEYFHSQHYTSEKYTPRKLQLPEQGDINLFGVRGAGKTSLILAYIEEIDEEERLYIDFEDPNLTFKTLSTVTLQHYIDDNGITLLVLDQYEADYLESFPNVNRLIVITRIPLDDAYPYRAFSFGL